MFIWQLSPRTSQSHDLVVGRPNLRPVKALHKVTFNQQTIGSVAMTHRSPIQADEKYSNYSRASKGETLALDY